MPRLSIAILSNHGPCALETTLVSVLENRPADCEIVVGLAHAYDDPYQLDGEVRFVPVDAATISLDRDNAALCQCRGEVVHILESGVRVAEDWADAALAHFDRDAHIGSVAPLVVNGRDTSKVASAGVDFSLAGKRKLRSSGMSRSRFVETHARPQLVLGPSAAAGFYRREALLTACQGLGCVAGDGMADADVALSLAALGYLSVLDPASVVYGHGSPAKMPATVAAGRAAETVFWRHAAAGGWLVSLAGHTALVVGEFIAALVRPALAKRLLGRLIGTCGAFGHVGHADRLVKRHRPADEDSSTGLSLILIDAAHPSSDADPRTSATRRAA
ncbi:MAG: glycosyltransferase family 2 protein [Pirellulales bacterium]